MESLAETSKYSFELDSNFEALLGDLDISLETCWTNEERLQLISQFIHEHGLNEVGRGNDKIVVRLPESPYVMGIYHREGYLGHIAITNIAWTLFPKCVAPILKTSSVIGEGHSSRVNIVIKPYYHPHEGDPALNHERIVAVLKEVKAGLSVVCDFVPRLPVEVDKGSDPSQWIVTEEGPVHIDEIMLLNTLWHLNRVVRHHGSSAGLQQRIDQLHTEIISRVKYGSDQSLLPQRLDAITTSIDIIRSSVA